MFSRTIARSNSLLTARTTFSNPFPGVANPKLPMTGTGPEGAAGKGPVRSSGRGNAWTRGSAQRSVGSGTQYASK
jgi:hypothetical protein